MAWRIFGMPRLAEYRWLRGLWAASASFSTATSGRGEVGVAEPQVDDVAPVPTRVRLQVVDGGEHIRRQAIDPAELHGPGYRHTPATRDAGRPVHHAGPGRRLTGRPGPGCPAPPRPPRRSPRASRARRKRPRWHRPLPPRRAAP